MKNDATNANRYSFVSLSTKGSRTIATAPSAASTTPQGRRRGSVTRASRPRGRGTGGGGVSLAPPFFGGGAPGGFAAPPGGGPAEDGARRAIDPGEDGRR